MFFSILRKMAFIANLAFLTAMVMRFYPFAQGTALASSLIVTGLVVSPVLNLFCLVSLLLPAGRKQREKEKWILVVNLAFLLVQAVLFFFFTGWLSLGNSQL